MKKRYFVLYVLVLLGIICGCAYADVPVDEAHFPDEIFRDYVRSEFDKNSDDILSDYEIIYAEKISISHSHVSSLKGIEYFSCLRSLYCYNNPITELNLKHNTILEWLDCSDTQLTALNVSNNAFLKFLDCDNNQLTELDISNNKALSSLYCTNNKLTQLDLGTIWFCRL